MLSNLKENLLSATAKKFKTALAIQIHQPALKFTLKMNKKVHLD